MLKEGEIRIPAGCAISSCFSKSGKNICGDRIVKSMGVMHDRSNGLGAGYAGYGIYPQYKDYYAFHIFYDSTKAREECEQFLEKHFDIINLSKIPVKKTPAITDEPLIWRYFVAPLPTKLTESQLDEKEFVVRCTIRINIEIDGAYIFQAAKIWAFSRLSAIPRMSANFTALMNTRAIAGLPTAAIRRTLPAGGAARTPLQCLICRLCTTEKFHLMTQTDAILRCSDTNARF